MEIERTLNPIQLEIVGSKIARVRSHAMDLLNVITAHRLDINSKEVLKHD